MLLDLNADVGEECGDDSTLIPLLTSANVACGAHAGDAAVMRRTVDLCLAHGVHVGAHVSYPDRENFGRRDLALTPGQITASVNEQLQALSEVARAAGTRFTYVKAHGALYNRMADDGATADAVIAALRAFDPTLVLLTLPQCIAMQRARAQGLEAVGEAFADRAYREDGRLQPRREAGAVLTDTATVAVRALAWARDGVMPSASGRSLKIQARSLCVHGDTPGAVALAKALRTVLLQAGVELKAFA
ncbi:MAG TPA: 5-oxoprolinase subunit PxpA [Gammaproteobacteria bacterium]|nr:5-oxoprolinase subunit PxpA [Gammaproteobacteria bacterium]